MNELLAEIKERLNQISITGLKSAAQDFRLKKLNESLKSISKDVPVFLKLSELISKLIEDSNFKIFSDTINLINAVMYTKTSIILSESKSELNLLNHNIDEKYLSFREFINIKECLSGGSSSKWATLKQLYDEKKLSDYRLINLLLDELGSTFVYKDNFNIVTVFSSYGQDISQILLDRFDSSSNTAKSNIIKILCCVGKQIYNEQYMKWIEAESDENVLYNAIKALSYDIKNEKFLLDFKLKKKKLKEARIYSLLYMKSNHIYEEAKKFFLKNSQIFLNIFSEIHDKIEPVVFTMISEIFNELKNEAQQSGVYEKDDNYNFLCTLINCTPQYQNKNAVNMLIQIIESELEQKYNSQYAALNLMKQKDNYALQYLANIANRYDGYYICISFAAALKICTKEEIFDRFSETVFKKSSQNNMSVADMIKNIFYSNYIKYENISDECLTCSSYPNCSYISTGKSKNSDSKIELAPEIYITESQRNGIHWDKRWFEFIFKQEDSELSDVVTYFISDDIDINTVQKLKLYYIECLNHLKESVPNKYFPNETSKGRKKTEEEIRNIMHGLICTGSKDIAIDNIVYFTFHLSSLKNIFAKNIKEEDLKHLDEIEQSLKNYPKHIRKSVHEFILQIKSNIIITITK